MEERYPDGDSAVSEERLDNTRCGLEQMKRKLDILRLAKAKRRGAVQKMNRNFIGNQRRVNVSLDMMLPTASCTLE